MTERAVPYYCPYCASEELRPREEPHGAWECLACARVFVVRLAGLVVRQ